MNTVSTLFEISSGHQLALNRVKIARSRSEDDVAYVARSHRNNGITAWVRPLPGVVPADAGSISVSLRSRNHSLSAFVQPRPFYTTYHVAVLTPRRPMDLQEKLWWCLCIRANRFRFHFGRQANRTLGSLELPSGMPQWARAVEVPTHNSIPPQELERSIDVSAWRRFNLTDLFTLEPGMHTSRGPLGSGSTPLVSASAWNNGISAYVGAAPDWPGGQITLPTNGSVGTAFFQRQPFTASRDVMVLVPRVPLSVGAALFICTVLRHEGARFNYARKWTISRMQESGLMLPQSMGAPDYSAMSDFMLQLPLGWSLRSLPQGAPALGG